jgi:hypothetical protein
LIQLVSSSGVVWLGSLKSRAGELDLNPTLHLRTTMASGEIDITKLSNEQLDGLRKQTESVGP